MNGQNNADLNTKNGLISNRNYKMTSRLSELRGCKLARSKYFQIGISQDLLYAFQNDFHHEKGHLLF